MTVDLRWFNVIDEVWVESFDGFRRLVEDSYSTLSAGRWETTTIGQIGHFDGIPVIADPDVPEGFVEIRGLGGEIVKRFEIPALVDDAQRRRRDGTIRPAPEWAGGYPQGQLHEIPPRPAKAPWPIAGLTEAEWIERFRKAAIEEPPTHSDGRRIGLDP